MVDPLAVLDDPTLDPKDLPDPQIDAIAKKTVPIPAIRVNGYQYRNAITHGKMQAHRWHSAGSKGAETGNSETRKST